MRAERPIHPGHFSARALREEAEWHRANRERLLALPEPKRTQLLVNLLDGLIRAYPVLAENFETFALEVESHERRWLEVAEAMERPQMPPKPDVASPRFVKQYGEWVTRAAVQQVKGEP